MSPQRLTQRLTSWFVDIYYTESGFIYSVAFEDYAILFFFFLGGGGGTMQYLTYLKSSALFQLNSQIIICKMVLHFFLQLYLSYKVILKYNHTFHSNTPTHPS